MKTKLVLTVAMMSLMTAGIAQKKATVDKQDEIIEKQKALDEKLDKVLEMQNEVQTLYGSNMDMNNDVSKMSYAYGLSIGENMKNQAITNIDFFAMNKGLLDAFTNGKDALMTVNEAQQFLNEYIGQLMAIKAEQAKIAGQKWLEENAKREGVTVTESGLQYEVLEEGEGASPGPKTEVTVHYHGTLTNGEVFDSSVNRGTPATFGLDKVIKGWTEGLQLMKEGAKYKFYIPSELGYGERSPGGSIGPNEVLVFEVELITVKK